MSNILERLATAKEDVRDLAIEWPLVHLFQLPSGARIVVVGAFKGRLIELMAVAYPDYYRIDGYEPQPDAWQEATERLHHLRDVHVHNCAVTPLSGKVALARVGSYHASIVSSPDADLAFEARAASDVFKGVYDLLLMNIEGYEGVLLGHIHANDKMHMFKRIAVQVHGAIAQERVSRALCDTHKLVYDDLPRWGYWVIA